MVVPDDTREYKVFGAVPIQGTSAPEDLDPWPGGLKQQFPIALDLGKQMLMGVTGASERAVSDQVLDKEDACGLILAQGSTPAEDAACVLFLGTDQMDALSKVDKMASGRLLCLLNPQFKRLSDFSIWQKGKAQASYFDAGYETTFAFEEFACRGEDVKLIGEYGIGWRAFVYLSDRTSKVCLYTQERCQNGQSTNGWRSRSIHSTRNHGGRAILTMWTRRDCASCVGTRMSRVSVIAPQ